MLKMTRMYLEVQFAYGSKTSTWNVCKAWNDYKSLRQPGYVCLNA